MKIRPEKYKFWAEDQLAKATELLKKVIKVTWGEGWNYSLDVKVETEQFLKECEK